MPFNTLTVATAVTPQVIETYVSHYLNRKALHQKPTAHISYHEGLHLIRQFLYYASHHTVEDIQAFTSQWVPHPRWVRVEDIKIPQKDIDAAGDAITSQLGREGIRQVGGVLWWQWRRQNSELKAEWIEMRGDYNARKKRDELGHRVMLYVHGGAYFFGSVDEHRYQMQRHARKLKAKLFAPRYRLAPQFPFPCGLQDCLAAYMYLLTVHAPSDIILAGDSAGGGMVVSMLVILREQELPLPAGAVLISPWVDLTHSFPSVAGDSSHDYIPAHGFMQQPSLSWPPPNSNEMEAVDKAAISKLAGEEIGNHHTRQERKKAGADAVQGFAVHHDEDARPPGQDGAADSPASEQHGETVPTIGRDLSIVLDGNLVEIKDQIQMYACNHLLSHPLVSPVLQPSLGGLPPMLILTGGGELLRDEQIYLAHKAANPSKYPPSTAILDAHDPSRTMLDKYKPTDVQLQVWDDLCHVAPTLSFTRPAKFMYRSIAQFGAWALARAQKTEIEILDDDNVSIISSGSDTDSEILSDTKAATKALSPDSTEAVAQVGKAGDALPQFHNHMIRQRLDRHGVIYPLPPASSLPSCRMMPDEIGAIKPGPVRKWMTAKAEWDIKYAHDRRRVQARRVKDMAAGGYETYEGDEVPPPSALAGRRRKGMKDDVEAKKRRGWGMMMWGLWGSKHDKSTIEREEKADAHPEVPLVKTITMVDASGRMRSVTAPSSVSNTDGATTRMRGFSLTKTGSRPSDSKSRSRSRRRTVTDVGQADNCDPSLLSGIQDSGNQDESDDPSRPQSSTAPNQPTHLSPSYIPALTRNKRSDLATEITTSLSPARTAERNPSTVALVGVSGANTPKTLSDEDDSSSVFDATKVRPKGTGAQRNMSAVAVMGHDGVCDDLDHKHENDHQGHDVRFDALGSARDNASTMCVAEEEGIRGIGQDRSEGASLVGTEKTAEDIMIGEGTGLHEKRQDGIVEKGAAPPAALERPGRIDQFETAREDIFGEKDDLSDGDDDSITELEFGPRKGRGKSKRAMEMMADRSNEPGEEEDDDGDDLFDIMAQVQKSNAKGRMHGQSFQKRK